MFHEQTDNKSSMENFHTFFSLKFLDILIKRTFKVLFMYKEGGIMFVCQLCLQELVARDSLKFSVLKDSEYYFGGMEISGCSKEREKYFSPVCCHFDINLNNCSEKGI